MPQKHPPARTAVSLDFDDASGASTAGLGKAALALARPSLGLAVAQARTPIPAKTSTAIRTARMVRAPKTAFRLSIRSPRVIGCFAGVRIAAARRLAAVKRPTARCRRRLEDLLEHSTLERSAIARHYTEV